MDWPLRELFLAYVERMKSAARVAYDVDLLVWAVLAAAGSKARKPDPPAVLKSAKIIIGGG